MADKKKSLVAAMIFVSIAPFLAAFVVPFYKYYLMSKFFWRYMSPFDYQGQGAVLLNMVVCASPEFFFAFILALSLVLLLRLPRKKRLMAAGIAFVVSFAVLAYTTVMIFDPSLAYIGELAYYYGSSWPLIAFMIYAGLLVHAFLARKTQ